MFTCPLYEYRTAEELTMIECFLFIEEYKEGPRLGVGIDIFGLPTEITKYFVVSKLGIHPCCVRISGTHTYMVHHVQEGGSNIFLQKGHKHQLLFICISREPARIPRQ